MMVCDFEELSTQIINDRNEAMLRIEDYFSEKNILKNKKKDENIEKIENEKNEPENEFLEMFINEGIK